MMQQLPMMLQTYDGAAPYDVTVDLFGADQTADPRNVLVSRQSVAFKIMFLRELLGTHAASEWLFTAVYSQV